MKSAPAIGSSCGAGLVLVAQHEDGELRRRGGLRVEVALDGVGVGQQDGGAGLGCHGVDQVVAFPID